MAQQVLLLNKMFNCFLLLFFVSCHSKQKTVVAIKYVLESDKNVQMQNGIVFYQGKEFSGTLYALCPNTNDTAFVNNYFEGKENGDWKFFYPNKNLQEIRSFSSGKKTGQLIAYWENGTKKLEYNFKEDEYEGTCSEWMPTGILVKEMNYIKGHEEGSQKLFFENGKVKSNYIISNGRRYGLLGTKNCVNVKGSVIK